MIRDTNTYNVSLHTLEAHEKPLDVPAYGTAGHAMWMLFDILTRNGLPCTAAEAEAAASAVGLTPGNVGSEISNWKRRNNFQVRERSKGE